MDNITVTVDLSGNFWVITASVTESTIVPKEIFIYENTGTVELGNYIGVANFQELQRLQVWKGQIIPKFGNRFVRTSQAKIQLPISANPDDAVKNLVDTAKKLKTEISAVTSSTTIYTL